MCIRIRRKVAIENVVMDWGTWLYSTYPHGGDDYMLLGNIANVLMHFPPRVFTNPIVSVKFHFYVNSWTTYPAQVRFDSLYECVRPATLAGANKPSSGISNWQAPGATGLPDDIKPGTDMIYVPGYPVYFNWQWNSVPIVNLTAFQEVMSGLRQIVMFSGYAAEVNISKTYPPYFEIEYRSNTGGIQIF